jgi:hypothetical protein
VTSVTSGIVARDSATRRASAACGRVGSTTSVVPFAVAGSVLMGREDHSFAAGAQAR